MNNERNIQDSSGDALRSRILEAARKCFRQFGFAKTSMQEIARASDMSPANLYRFYDGKLAIGTAVAGLEQLDLLAACDAAVAVAGANLPDRLIALFLANIDANRRKMKRTPLLFELDLVVARENKSLRQQFLREMETRVASIMAAGHQGRAFDSAAIKVRSRIILMSAAPFVLPWMMLNEPFDDPRPMVAPMINSLISGLGSGLPPVAAPAPH